LKTPRKTPQVPYSFSGLNVEFYVLAIFTIAALTIMGMFYGIVHIFFGTPQRGALTLGLLVLAVLWWKAVTLGV
jgi:hypothetical protein